MMPTICPKEKYPLELARVKRERALFVTCMDKLHAERHFSCIITGRARGADLLAECWAERNGIPFLGFPALWDTLGHAAGPIRNREMFEGAKPDLGIEFPGGSGTANMHEILHSAGIEIIMGEDCLL